jgi:hypothetical protein
MRNITIEEIIEIENQPFKEIRKYAKMALNLFKLSWRIGDIGDPGVYQNLNGYWIQFYDEENHPVEITLYNKPPEADSRWYMQEITRQLQEKLNNLR